MRKKTLVLPALPGLYRWGVTPHGARIFEDCRAKRHGMERRNVGHFTTAVLRHVLLGERLTGEKWHRRAHVLRQLLELWEISLAD